MQLRAIQGDTVDAMAWRHYGRTRGHVEAILAANPGLADLGPVLPIGTLVEMPAASATAPAAQPITQLWN